MKTQGVKATLTTLLLATLAGTAPTVASPAGPPAEAFVPASAGTSQQDSINAAILAAGGGGIVTLGPGSFTIDGAIVPRSGVWLRGSGVGVTVIQHRAGFNNYGILYSGWSALSYFRVSDLSVDCNESAQAESDEGGGIDIANPSVLEIGPVEVRNCKGHGIAVLSPKVPAAKVWIHDSYVRMVGRTTRTAGVGDGILVNAASGATEVMIQANVVDTVGKSGGATDGSGIEFAGAGTGRRILVADNVVSTTQASGIQIGTSGAPARTYAQVVVSGNAVYNVGLANVTNGVGIIVQQSAAETSVLGNSIDTVGPGSDNGIEISGATANVLVANNRIKNVQNPMKFGIWYGSVDYGVISGNLIQGCAGGGIKVENQSRSGIIPSLSITGNTVDTCTGASSPSMFIFGHGPMSISGNVLRNGGSTGIYLQEGQSNGQEIQDVSIAGNTITGHASDGIYVEGEAVGGGGNLVRRLAISGNTISTCRNGIVLLDVISATVLANVVDSNTRSGIVLGHVVRDAVLLGNQIRANGTEAHATYRHGVQLEGGGTYTDLRISGNMITDHSAPGQYAIKAGGTTTRVTAGDNHLQSNANTTDLALPSSTVSGSNQSVSLAGVRAMQLVAAGPGQTVSSFTGGEIGQSVAILFLDANVTLNESGNIKLDGTTLAGAKSKLAVFCYDGTKWQQTGVESAN